MARCWSGLCAGGLAVAALWSATGAAPAARADSPVSIGSLRVVRSRILDEDRTVSVRLPAAYDDGALAYPVVYLLYGDQAEGYFAEAVVALERLAGGAEVPECILVGIHNSDRYGDLLPVGRDGRPGGADRFIEFLQSELFPFVESSYRTKPYRLLVGPQAGGPFGLYTLIRRPSLFNAFVLENPLAPPQSRRLLADGLRELAAGPDLNVSMVINSFDRQGFQDGSGATTALAGLLEEIEASGRSGLAIRRRQVDEPTFVPSLELTPALRAIFAGFRPPEGETTTGLPGVLAHYREVSLRLGFDVDPPAFLLALTADELLRARRADAAHEVLAYALSLRPCDVDAMARMGNLLLGEGEPALAEPYFRALLEVHPDPFFARRLETVRRMLAGSAAYALSEALKQGPDAGRAKVAELEGGGDPAVYFDERELNALGYRLLGRGLAAEAVLVMEVAARRFPGSWNAHDSLGEAYAAAGRSEDAALSFEASLRINPDNRNAAAMLERLRR